jgi:hypothetical protein
MDNRIRELTIRNGQLIPAQSEVWVQVILERLTPTTELRGRLMGPRCAYAETVEVAYPLRTPTREQIPPGREILNARVIIPEACFWEPESPFLYQGPIELWQDGQRCEQIVISHGLRAFRLGQDGFRLNFRPLKLRGQRIGSFSNEDAIDLRRAGRNLLVVPVSRQTLPLWELADRLGFLMLGQVQDDREETIRSLHNLSRHPSCLGWLIEDGLHPPAAQFPPHTLIGLVVSSNVSPRQLNWVNFLLGSKELASLGKPLLVDGEMPPQSEAAVILGNVL